MCDKSLILHIIIIVRVIKITNMSQKLLLLIVYSLKIKREKGDLIMKQEKL